MANISIQNGIISSSANYGLYHGTKEIATITGDDIRVHGDIVAENYIVSSSITFMTQSFSSGSTAFGDSLTDTHSFSGSLNIKGGAGTDEFFLIRSGSFDAIKTDSDGVMVLGAFTFTPTARAGGFYYDSSDDEFYLGKSS